MSGEVPESEGGQPPTDPPARLHVFISYASQDAAVAAALVEALERHGVACWIAPRDIKAGALYADAIVRAISSAKAFVLVLSESAIASSHVSKEIERACSKKRPIIALRIDAAPLTPALEYFLSESQWVEAQAGSMEPAYSKLIGAIRDSAPTAPGIIPAVAAGTTAGKAPAAHPKSRNRILLGAGLAVVAVVLAGLLTDKFWLSKHVAPEQTKTAATNVVSDKSIAVLPFIDMSEKHDQEYFGDGMAEEIIDLLAKVPDLRVPARTSSFYFKGKSTKVPEIAHELGVAHVLEGSIRRSGNQIRVTAQLVRADNGFHLWSQTYDRDLQDVFKVQDDIANAVVQALQITLMGGPLTRQKGGTQNLEAYQLYLRAVSAELQNTKSSLESGREYLEQAIKLDPTFGLAWAWMALNSMELADSGYVLPTEGYPRAKQQAQHALELSPDLVMAHYVLQHVYQYYDWDWAASEAEGRRALSVDPTNSRALMGAGLLASTLGHGDNAERQLRAALASDPLNTFARFSLGLVQYYAGRFASADASYRKLIVLAPDFEWTHMYLSKALLAEGKPDEALAMVRLDTEEEARLELLPIVLQATGHKAEADEALKALATKFSATSAYFVAMSYAYRNDRDLALQWLDRAYKQKDASLAEIVGEPLFKNLASDPGYKAFLRRMNLPE
jgi:TolB-like protein/Tfp pilus assembly protein PilF